MGTVSEAGLGLANRRFGRGDEYAADDQGLNYLVQAGYNPQAYRGVFEVLSQASAGATTPEFLRTHPLSENRIQRLDARYRQATNP